MQRARQNSSNLTRCDAIHSEIHPAITACEIHGFTCSGKNSVFFQPNSKIHTVKSGCI